MPVLTDLAAAQVTAKAKILYGKVLTHPALLVSDGLNVIYACDVDIGPTDPTGRISQYYEQNSHWWNSDKTAPRLDIHGHTTPSDLSGLPGQDTWDLDADAMVNTVLHNVTIARNNANLIYAEVGTAVTLTRSASGQWQITGFSQEMPGTYTMIPVNLDLMQIGTVIDLSLDGRMLTFEEFGTLKPFGTLPLGASGLFIGGVLQKIL